MPPRKRKIEATTDNELMPPPRMPASKKPKGSKKQTSVQNISIVSNASNISLSNVSLNVTSNHTCGPLSAVFEKVQTIEIIHPKYFKEVTQIYERMNDHDKFMKFFLKGIRIWMKYDDTNNFANNGLGFLAQYLSSLRCDDPDVITHPILRSTFVYFLNTISPSNVIRFRICQFVNLLLSAMSTEANIDDDIFEDILRYMLDRMKDLSPSVRVQAVYALQRLQLPENPDDAVVRTYQYHLNNDPSVLVRQAVLKSIGRSALTVPIILERLWDVDERVRRRTYLQMSSHPVKSYKVAQRLMLLEQGVADHSEGVRKIVTNVLLPQWLTSYNKKYLLLIAALKLDANQEEIQRFVKVTKKALSYLFKSDSIDELINQLPLSKEGEFIRCIPFDKLTVELAVYWLALVEFIQETDTNDDDEDQLQDVICELSNFCEYLSKYINYIKDLADQDPESWETQENQFKLHILIEILLKFDLGDEIGRQNLSLFVSKALTTQILGESVVEKLVKCVENLLPDSDTRLQYFIDIIRSIIEPSSSIDVADPSITRIMDNIKDPETKVKIGQLKLEIMDLREQENELSKRKDFNSLERVNEKMASCCEEFMSIINKCTMIDPNLTASTIVELNATLSSNSKKVSRESILHCLEICFFAVCSKQTPSITPNMFKLYEDFVQRHMKSQHMDIRDRALKCGIAFSMLYDQLAKDVHEELYNQFVRHHQPRIWTTAVHGICEMFDKYGIDFFAYEEADEDKSSTSKAKKTRQLYNKPADPDEDEDETSTGKNGTNVMYLFTHLFDTCQETSINMALATGFCRLILGGHYDTSEILSKIILKFFNPTTCTEINQILSVFFATLIQRGKQECLEKALMPTLFTILDAPNESPLREIKGDAVVKFVVNTTLPSSAPSTAPNVHNAIALTFLKTMHEHSTNKELLKILSKELQTLEVDNNPGVRDELKELTDTLLEKSLNDAKIKGYLKTFKDILSGLYTKRRSAGNPDENASDDEQSGDEEQENNPPTENGQAQTSIAADADSSGIIDENAAFGASNRNNVSNANRPPRLDSLVQNDAEMDNNNRVRNESYISSDEESQVTSATWKNKNNSTKRTAKQNGKQLNADDEIENCRIVTSSQEQSEDDDEADVTDVDHDDSEIPNTPTATPVAEIRSKAQKGNQAASKSQKKPNDNSASKVVESPKTPAAKRPRQARIQLTPLDMAAIERQTGHRTRNARVAEFKEKNIMTRNRKSLEQIKSTTQRINLLKKIAPNSKEPPSTNQSPVASTSTSNASSRKSSTSSPTSRGHSTPKVSRNTSLPLPSPPSAILQPRKAAIASQPNKSNSLKRARPDSRQKANQNTTKENDKALSTPSPKHRASRTRSSAIESTSAPSSPSVTPLPKRRSTAQHSSPVLIGVRKSKTPASATETTAKGKTSENPTTSRRVVPGGNARQAATTSRIPTKTTSTASTTTAQNTQRVNRSLQSAAQKSKLPLRKSNRSASHVTLRRK